MSDDKHRSIGFRVEPTKVHWAVVEGTVEEPILVAAHNMPAPKGFNEAQSLSWYRREISDLIDRYSPLIAGIRDSEAHRNARVQALQQRCRIEGVAIEAINAKGLKVVSGRMATISSNIGSKGAKKYLDDDSFRGIDWSRKPLGIQEAIMVAVSALGEI